MLKQREDVPGFRNLYPIQLVAPLGFLIYAASGIASNGLQRAVVAVIAIALCRVAFVRLDLGPSWLLVGNFWRSYRIEAENIEGFIPGRAAMPSYTEFWGGAVAVLLRDGTTLNMHATHGYGYGSGTLRPTRGTIERYEQLQRWALENGCGWEVEVVDLILRPGPTRSLDWPHGG